MATKVGKTRYKGYAGEINNQLRDGFGVYYYNNKFFRYEGDWLKGMKHGHGKLIMADGSYYEGEFKEGEIEGHGFRKWQHNGNSYSGEFHLGELHGYGVLNYPDGSQYKGEFFKNSRHGNGIFVDKFGNEYEGTWYNNKQHGHGILTLCNGDIYEGDFIHGRRQGHGNLRATDGTEYDGQWNADVFNGEGSMHHCSGVSYNGLWLNGKPALTATKLALIDESQSAECIQGKTFDLALCIQDQESNVLTEESGRKFEVTAGYRYPTSTKSRQSLLELIEDIEEKPIETPFGYEVLPYALTEADSVDNITDTSTVSITAKSIHEDSSTEELTQSFAKNSDNLEKQPSLMDSSITTLDESRSLCQQSFSSKVAIDGILEMKNMFLPYVHINYKSDETKSKKSKGSRAASAVSSSSSDGKVASKTKLQTEKGAKPGEYVLIIKDVTDPPFFDKLETFFHVITIVVPKQPKKSKSKHAA